MRKFLLLIAVALFSIGTYAQDALWSSSIQAVEATDAADYKSPAAFDNEGNLYVTGTQTVGFDFAENEVESLGIGAYIAKYNVAGAELFAIALQGGVTVTATFSSTLQRHKQCPVKCFLQHVLVSQSDSLNQKGAFL